MNQLLQHYAAHQDAVNSISIHPSGDYMVSASSDMTTKIWDLREGHLCYTLHGHERAVCAAAFSPAGDYLASGSGGCLPFCMQLRLFFLHAAVLTSGTV
jgi:centriolar protein POC1